MSIRAPYLLAPLLRAMIAAGLACLLVVGGGCGSGQEPNPDVVVSILPQAWLAERIGGPDLQVDVLVGPGQSPATFDPGPRQIARLMEAGLFVRAGVPFERGLLPKIERMPGAPRMLAPVGVPEDLLQAAQPDHAGHGHDHGDHDHGGLDPHSWLDPAAFRQTADQVCDALCELMPSHADSFRARTAVLDHELQGLDEGIRELLAPYRGSSFFVFHPAYGHFAQAYGLHQIAIELDGHEPGARHLADVIAQARRTGARAIIVQPQFSSDTAQRVADEIGGEVIALDPLAYDYATNLRHLAEALAGLLADRPVPDRSGS